MRAWLMDSYDGIDRLRLGDVPDPKPGTGQVLLKMRYAALNPADIFLAQAMYPADPPLRISWVATAPVKYWRLARGKPPYGLAKLWVFSRVTRACADEPESNLYR